MDSRQQRFLRLIEPHHASALAFARCLCRSDADGDDVFQSALVRALERLDQLRDENAFRAWFYRIVVSIHRNRVKQPFWRRAVPLDDDHASGSASADDALAGSQRARIALATLPAEQRETIVLFEIEGMTIEEIAALHNTSISAVKSRLVRARDRLRSVYTKRLGAAHLAVLPSPEMSHE
jgi:RNA polymerase sigma-70 factor (ECF subfamily)